MSEFSDNAERKPSADADIARIRMQPHSIEAERSVLGGLLLSSDGWDAIAEIVTSGDFYRPEHRAIFRQIEKLVDRGEPVDVITVADSLHASGELESAGGHQYLAELAEQTPTAANIRAYATAVHERAVLRKLILAAQDIATTGFHPEGRSAEELLDEAERRIMQISEEGPKSGGPRGMEPLLTGALERIEELFNSGGDITGLTTGFIDLDGMTSGLQPSDLVIVAGRPSMGKCIVEGSLLVDPESGERRPIEDLVRREDGAVISLDNQFRLKRKQASHFVDDGLKPVFRVRTALGRTIHTTATHPFLTGDGWQALSDVSVGDHVAVPRCLPIFGNAILPEHEVRALAYFISDGGTTGSSPVFTNTNDIILQDFASTMGGFFGVKLVRTDDSFRAPSYRVSARAESPESLRALFSSALVSAMERLRLTGRQLAATLGTAASTVSQWRTGLAVPAPLLYPPLCDVLDAEFRDQTHDVFGAASSRYNPVIDFLRRFGLWGKAAHEKFIPEAVFSLPRQQMATFLGCLYACDGSVSISTTGQVRISYGTASLELAEQVQHLLLRFGVLAKLRTKTHHARAQYEVEVLSRESALAFLDAIEIVGKAPACHAARERLASRRIHSNVDSLPESAIDYLLTLKGSRSWREIFAAKGRVLPEGFNPHFSPAGRRLLSRRRALEFADLLDDAYLRDLATSDVYWDRITDIEYIGLKQVYDLTVPDLHNFIAQDIFVHNTSFAMNLVENAALGSDKPILVFSMEMPAEQLVIRMLSSLGRIDQGRVRNGKLEQDDWPKLSAAMNKLKEARIFIDDTPALTPTELRTRARRVAREHGELGMVMVDYLQLMRVAGSSEGRTAEISEISRSLKAIAKEFRCPMVALSQLNRSLEQRPNKRPVNSDLRESGAIEQDADVIMFIYRDEVYHEDSLDKGVAEIIIGKQRNGPIGTCKLAFRGEYTRFENLARGHYDGYE